MSYVTGGDNPDRVTHPSQEDAEDFDAFAFERELAQAEHQLKLASRQLALNDSTQPTELPSPTLSKTQLLSGTNTATAEEEDDGGMVFRGFNLLAGGREALRRQRLAAADARLVNPRATLIVTAIAWILSVIAAIIAVTFATKDFIEAVRNPLLATKFETLNTVRAPVINICTSQLDVGPYPMQDRNDTHSGAPIFAIRLVQNLENDTVAFWPNTIDGASNSTTNKEGDENNIIVTGAYRGPEGSKCARTFSAISVEDGKEDKATSLAREDLKENCQFCYQIGRNPPLYFDRTRQKSRSQINPFIEREGLRLHIVSSPFYRNCLNYDDTNRVGDTHWDFMQKEIRRNAEKLQEEGIVKWNGADGNGSFSGRAFDRTLVTSAIGDEVEELFGGEDVGEEDADLNFDKVGPAVDSAQDMMCHVYYYSGFFFPRNRTTNGDIRYEYNKTSLQWMRKSGNFLRKRRDSSELVGSMDLAKQGFNRVLRPLEVYIEDPEEDEQPQRLADDVSKVIGTKHLYRIKENARHIATLEVLTQADIVFRMQRDKTKNKGRLAFKSTTSLTDVDQALGRVLYWSNMITFRLDNFRAETITRKESIDVMQYVVDVIGYVSMALGITIYSLLIGPTNLFFLGVERPRKKTNGDASEDISETGVDEGEAVLLEDRPSTAGAGAAERSRSGTGGLRFRFGVQRRHLGGPSDPLRRIV